MLDDVALNYMHCEDVRNIMYLRPRNTEREKESKMRYGAKQAKRYARRRTVCTFGFRSTACSIFRILPWYSSTTSRAESTTVT